jgi:two-component system, cell cycle sensor histidine kinase and response regulator CckA
MPELSGRELLLRARQLRPELPVVFVSGYTDDVVLDDGDAASPFLAKPFSREALLDAVDKALPKAA